MTTFDVVYELVKQIPYGRVCTYGQIAKLMGNARLSRVVGYAMGPAPADVPCHRVVKKDGVLSDAFMPLGKETHRMLLEMENVPFLPDGRVDLDVCFWSGPLTCGQIAPDTAPNPPE